MLKIAVLTSQLFRLGGAERLSVELALGLNSAEGYQADLIVSCPTDDPVSREKRRELAGAGLRVECLNRGPGAGIIGTVGAVFRLRRLLREGDYDLIETALMGTGFLAALATVGRATQHVCGIHDLYRRSLHSGLRHVLWRLVTRFSPGVHFYAISEAVKRDWMSYSRVASDRVAVVLNSFSARAVGVTANRTEVRAALGVPVDAPIAICVGRLMHRKGIDTAYEALCPLLSAGRGYLVYVGYDREAENLTCDDAALRARILDSIQSKGLEGRVIFLGWRDDVANLISAADVLVHVPRREGFGLVVLEAMALGIPIVATRVDGIPEVVAGTEVLLVEPGDTVGLREAVERVIAWPPPQRELSSRASRARAAEFTERRRVSNMQAYFERVLQHS